MIKDKIKSISELKDIISRLKTKGKKIVFTNGCFDLLHYGHVRYLEQAKAFGDILIVAVNSDKSIKRIKGDKRPIVNQADRLRTIAALESVDYAVLFKQDTPLEIIKTLKPDVIVKGSDWKKKDIVGSNIISQWKGKVLNVRLLKGRSTTNLINRIVKKY